MTLNIQPLESYRIGRVQLPIPCALCGHDNTFEAAECRSCHAPMAIGRIAVGDKKKSKPQLIMSLGADGVGKTVYLGMLLDLLNREQDRCELQTCGAGTVSIQQEVIRSLARGEFPSTTSSEESDWRWAHLRLTQRSRRSQLDVFLSDIAGHGLMKELETPGSNLLVAPLMTKATGVLLLVDAERVAADDKDEEYFARQLVSHLIELREIEHEANRHSQTKHTRRQRKSTANVFPPVAMLLTKSDQCPEACQSPAEFVRSRMPAFWAEVEGQLPQFKVFSVSVVGAVAKQRSSTGYMIDMPLRVEPSGIIEPFRWLIRQSGNGLGAS